MSPWTPVQQSKLKLLCVCVSLSLSTYVTDFNRRTSHRRQERPSLFPCGPESSFAGSWCTGQPFIPSSSEARSHLVFNIQRASVVVEEFQSVHVAVPRSPEDGVGPPLRKDQAERGSGELPALRPFPSQVTTTAEGPLPRGTEPRLASGVCRMAV
jgi:hypothetical protein